MKWTLNEIIYWTEAEWISDFEMKPESTFNEVTTDTRLNIANSVFVALKGDQFDAHNFLDVAVKKNVGLLIVDHLPNNFSNLKSQVPILLVKNTLTALQNFAHHYRKKLKTKIIGITGSNGKTSTKEFTAKILNQYKRTHFNQGSFNNHWGVPLTLLNMDNSHELAVIEMGMNHAMEIAELVRISDPDYVVCTMVGLAHIEFFGTQKKIAEAKSEIYMYSKESTVRIFNQDQDLTFDMMYPVAKKFPAGRMLTFSSINDKADVFFKLDSSSIQGLKVSGLIGDVPGHALIPVIGDHNLVNLMAAANLAFAVGMPPNQIWTALSLCESTWGRNQLLTGPNNTTILFDGYNANPDSMNALLNTIQKLKFESPAVLALGQMKELGQHSKEMHFELGEKVANLILDKQNIFTKIYFIGENYLDFKNGLVKNGFKNFICDQELNSTMIEDFKATMALTKTLFVKGSRGAKTERFLECLGIKLTK